MTMGHHLARRTAYTALVIAISLLLFVLWLLLFPADGVSYEGDATTNKEAYAAGDIVIVDGGNYCNNGVDVTIERKLANQYGALLLPPLEFYHAPLDTPACFPVKYQIQVPDDIPAGIWFFQFVITYQANPVRSVQVVRHTNDFAITSDVPPVDVTTGRPT